MKGYLSFTSAGRFFAFVTADRRNPAQNTEQPTDMFRSIIAYSGSYRPEWDKFTTTVDLVWHEAWPLTEHVRHYQLASNKRLIEIAPNRYPDAFGSMIVSVLLWERE